MREGEGGQIAYIVKLPIADLKILEIAQITLSQVNNIPVLQLMEDIQDWQQSEGEVK